MDCQSIPAYHDGNDERQIQPLIESLLSVLKSEIDLQKELRRSLEEERRLLRKPDSNQLLNNNTKKESILLKAMMLDEVIADIVKKISRIVNIREQPVTLSDLSGYATPPVQAELLSCRKLLASLVMKNRELNLNNRDLLDMLLRLVNNSMRVITNLMSADSDYIGSGQRNPARMTGAVLCMKG
jgi:flagellar biosynthesis/type III secretory pathway chaperone